MGLNPAVRYFVPRIQVCVPVMAVSEVGPVIGETNIQWQTQQFTALELGAAK
jgi:hypothetical protein